MRIIGAAPGRVGGTGRRVSVAVVSGTLAIARRELVAAFGRPLAWAVLALFVAVFALLTLWFDDLLLGRVASLRQPLFWLSVCLLFLVPATTMRSFAEEHREGTWQVLYALPLSPVAIVVGKWLGAVGVCCAALLLTVPWPFALVVLGDPDPGPMVGGYLGVLLGASALAAVGVAASALAESQVLAYLVSLTLAFVPWLVGRALPLVPAPAVPLVERFTFDHHFDALARGMLDLESVGFFLGVTAVALRVAVHRLEHGRLAS